MKQSRPTRPTAEGRRWAYATAPECLGLEAELEEAGYVPSLEEDRCHAAAHQGRGGRMTPLHLSHPLGGGVRGVGWRAARHTPISVSWGSRESVRGLERGRGMDGGG